VRAPLASAAYVSADERDNTGLISQICANAPGIFRQNKDTQNIAENIEFRHKAPFVTESNHLYISNYPVDQFVIPYISHLVNFHPACPGISTYRPDAESKIPLKMLTISIPGIRHVSLHCSIIFIFVIMGQGQDQKLQSI
jgi:hypothetical protein